MDWQAEARGCGLAQHRLGFQGERSSSDVWDSRGSEARDQASDCAWLYCDLGASQAEGGLGIPVQCPHYQDKGPPGSSPLGSGSGGSSPLASGSDGSSPLGSGSGSSSPLGSGSGGSSPLGSGSGGSSPLGYGAGVSGVPPACSHLWSSRSSSVGSGSPNSCLHFLHCSC
ncbi:UNVERIFIED_CONTAM: hypothetical protein FKN15_013626 [Acipenser sinensis]